MTLVRGFVAVLCAVFALGFLGCDDGKGSFGRLDAEYKAFLKGKNKAVKEDKQEKQEMEEPLADPATPGAW